VTPLEEILEHGRNAFLCESGDEESWRVALEAIRDRPEEANAVVAGVLDD
jgi:hypothetical protein